MRNILLFTLLSICLLIPTIYAECPGNLKECDNIIEDYIIDGNIDIRTLENEKSQEEAEIETSAGRESEKDDYDYCVDVYNNAFSQGKESEEYCTDNPEEKGWIEDSKSYYIKEGSFEAYYSSSSIEQQSIEAATACWGCEAGTYESADRESYCDCNEDEECYDYFTQSTAVAGGSSACFMSCSYEERTDYCSDLNTLIEYYVDCYCCDEVFSVSYNCNNANGNSIWYYYCSGDELWKHRYYFDYDCGDGACFHDVDGSGWYDDQYDRTCACGCTDGACISPCPPSIRVEPTSLNFEV